MADCSKRSMHGELKSKFGVSGLPTVVFLDSKGNKVGKLGARDAGSVKTQMLSVIEKYSAKVFLDVSLSEARVAAAEQNKLLGVVFVDDTAKAKKKNDLAFAVLAGDSMEAVRKQIVWVKRPLKDGKKQTDEAKEVHATKSPTLVIMDPKAEGKAAVLKKLTSFKPKNLQKTLEKLLAKRAK